MQIIDPAVVIVESLAHLDRLPSEFTLAVLPLKLSGLDGSPARAIAMIADGFPLDDAPSLNDAQ